MQLDRGAPVRRKLAARDHGGELFVVELAKRLIRPAFRNQRRSLLLQALEHMAAVERHVGAPFDRAAFQRLRPRRIVAQLGHRHDGKLKALAGVDGHDAHEIAAFGGQRARRLLCELHAQRQLLGHARGPHAAGRLDIARHADGLVHVPRARQPLGTGRLKTRKPPGIGHNALHDIGERHVSHLLGGAAHQACARRKRRRDRAPRRHLALDMAKALVERPSARNAALLVHPRGQLQQIIGGQGEQLAREHLEQRSGPLRVRDGLRQANHKRHLGRTVEDGAAGHHARQPLGPQRLGIYVRAAHAAEQHHHVARPVPGRRELGERLRHTPRRHGRRIRRRHAARRGHGHLHLHAGPIRQERTLDLGFRAPRRQRHELGAEHLRLLEDAVAQRQHVPVATEVVGQLDDALGVAAAHILQMAAIHRHVRAAEPVDALLRVADGAHAREAFPGHALDHVNLQLIGVLELVYHHQLEAVGVRRLDGGMVAKRAGREGQQVVVVQQPRLALAARERVRNRLRHIDQRRQLLLHQPAARLRGNGAILFRQLNGLFAIQRVLAEVATGDGKAVHGRKRAPIRQPVGAASDQLACALQRILRCRQEPVARGARLDAVSQGIRGIGDVHQLCQQLDRARRLGRRHQRRHAVGMRRDSLDQLPHHPFDRRRARTGRVHVERCEQRIKTLR